MIQQKTHAELVDICHIIDEALTRQVHQLCGVHRTLADVDVDEQNRSPVRHDAIANGKTSFYWLKNNNLQPVPSGSYTLEEELHPNDVEGLLFMFSMAYGGVIEPQQIPSPEPEPEPEQVVAPKTESATVTETTPELVMEVTSVSESAVEAVTVTRTTPEPEASVVAETESEQAATTDGVAVGK